MSVELVCHAVVTAAQPAFRWTSGVERAIRAGQKDIVIGSSWAMLHFELEIETQTLLRYRVDPELRMYKENTMLLPDVHQTSSAPRCDTKGFGL